MPTYEYTCEECGTFEYFQKITDEALKQCPKCSSAVKRLVVGGNFVLKGSGWYKTDYASAGSSSGGTPSGSDSEKPKSAEEKPTEKKESTPSSS